MPARTRFRSAAARSRSGPTAKFYRSVEGKQLMSVAVKTGRELVAQPPTTLFDTSKFASFIGRNYDITPDGKRFVFVKNPAVPAQTLITVVLDWTEELKRIK
jgi:hypothetical protein